MKVKGIWLACLILAGCARSDRFRPLEWKVGQWVCYEINDEPLEVAIVGKDSDLFWLETIEPEITVKALVAKDRINEPKRLIVKRIGETPVEFQVSEFLVKSGLPVLKGEDSGKKEILTLPCGKVKVVHITEDQRDIWLSRTVPIFGIAKYESDDMLIVLQNCGQRGAKSSIGEPVEVVNL
jgi:hypothetical protein